MRDGKPASISVGKHHAGKVTAVPQRCRPPPQQQTAAAHVTYLCRHLDPPPLLGALYWVEARLVRGAARGDVGVVAAQLRDERGCAAG